MLMLTQPCQDVFADVNDCDEKDRQVVHLDSSPETDPGPDECSPFCICSCCSLTVIDRSFSFSISADAKSAPVTKALAEYTNPYTKVHQNSIWQPPKA